MQIARGVAITALYGEVTVTGITGKNEVFCPKVNRF